MSTFRAYCTSALLLFLTLVLLSCTGNSSSNLGVSEAGLAPCPTSPNCVSSDADDNEHRIPALQLAVPPPKAWPAVRKLVAKLPRTRIVKETPGYLHAECRSALFGFVDDLELDLRSSLGIIAVRSASRLGYSDLGVNRQRVENLRAALIRRGIGR